MLFESEDSLLKEAKGQPKYEMQGFRADALNLNHDPLCAAMPFESEELLLKHGAKWQRT